MDFPSLVLIAGLVLPGSAFAFQISGLAFPGSGAGSQGGGGLPFQGAPAQPVSTATPQPGPVISTELRGDIMMARKMYREAIDLYKPGAEKSSILANKTGIAYQQLLELSSARRYYEKAIKLNPQYAEAVNNLGTVYYAQKSYRRAVEQYRKALRLQPESASFLSNLGTAYFARKNYNQALASYQQALALDPEIFEHHNTVGTTLQDTSVEEKAKLHYFVAKTYAKAGTKDRALQYIRKALEEGFKEREKFLKDPEFASLQDDPEFKQMMAMEQKVL
jgi:tetratricopeptide (TPR) repeat protein